MQKQKLKTEKAPCGEDTMIFMKDKELEPRSGQRMKVWESLRQCAYDNERISAVKIEVLLNAKGLDWVKISEVKDGKLFGIKFNDSLEPIEGEFPSGSETVELQRGKLIGFLNAAEESIWGKKEFFRHAMGTQEELTTTRIQSMGTSGVRVLYFPRRIVSEMRLEDKMSCKWEEDKDSLVMTPLKEAAIQARVQRLHNPLTAHNSLMVAIPEEMLLVADLRQGDYLVCSDEDKRLFIRKANEGEPGAQQIGMIRQSHAIAIPEEIADKLDVRKGMYGVWTFDEGGLGLEFSNENPHITRIYRTRIEEANFFIIDIPKGMGSISGRDEAILEAKDGKLYITKWQSQKGGVDFNPPTGIQEEPATTTIQVSSGRRLILLPKKRFHRCI